MSGTGHQAPDSVTWRVDAPAAPAEVPSPRERPESARSGAIIAQRVTWGWGSVAIGVLAAVGCFFALIAVILGALELAGIELDETSPGGLALNALLYVSFIGVPFAVASRNGNSPWQALGFQGIRWRQLWWAPVGLVLTYVALISLVLLMQAIGVEAEGNLDDELFEDRATVVVAFIAIGLMAPFAEEIFFRAFIFAGIARSAGVIPALAVSGLLFGAAHFQLSLLLPFSAVGVVFAFLYLRTRSVFTSILVHAAFNCISLILGISGVGE